MTHHHGDALYMYSQNFGDWTDQSFSFGDEPPLFETIVDRNMQTLKLRPCSRICDMTEIEHVIVTITQACTALDEYLLFLNDGISRFGYINIMIIPSLEGAVQSGNVLMDTILGWTFEELGTKDNSEWDKLEEDQKNEIVSVPKDLPVLKGTLWTSHGQNIMARWIALKCNVAESCFRLLLRMNGEQEQFEASLSRSKSYFPKIGEELETFRNFWDSCRSVLEEMDKSDNGERAAQAQKRFSAESRLKNAGAILSSSLSQAQQALKDIDELDAQNTEKIEQITSTIIEAKANFDLFLAALAALKTKKTKANSNKNPNYCNQIEKEEATSSENIDELEHDFNQESQEYEQKAEESEAKESLQEVSASDEYYVSSGAQGDEIVEELRTDASNLSTLVYRSVVVELHDKLAEKKIEMTARERIAYEKANGVPPPEDEIEIEQDQDEVDDSPSSSLEGGDALNFYMPDFKRDLKAALASKLVISQKEEQFCDSEYDDFSDSDS